MGSGVSLSPCFSKSLERGFSCGRSHAGSLSDWGNKALGWPQIKLGEQGHNEDIYPTPTPVEDQLLKVGSLEILENGEGTL